jgi:hypothetical protein
MLWKYSSLPDAYACVMYWEFVIAGYMASVVQCVCAAETLSVVASIAEASPRAHEDYM